MMQMVEWITSTQRLPLTASTLNEYIEKVNGIEEEVDTNELPEEGVVEVVKDEDGQDNAVVQYTDTHQ